MPSPLDRRSRARRAGGDPRIRPYRASFVSMGALVVLAFLVVATITVPPWWVATLLAVGWLVLFVLACGWFARRPRWMPALPIVGYVVWALVVGLGVRVSGWR